MVWRLYFGFLPTGDGAGPNPAGEPVAPLTLMGPGRGRRRIFGACVTQGAGNPAPPSPVPVCTARKISGRGGYDYSHKFAGFLLGIIGKQSDFPDSNHYPYAVVLSIRFRRPAYPNNQSEMPGELPKYVHFPAGTPHPEHPPATFLSLSFVFAI